MPHATIGVGIFMAASLHASVAAGGVPYHEYQHSIFDRNAAVRRHVDGVHGGLLSAPRRSRTRRDAASRIVELSCVASRAARNAGGRV
jgi:hypothetical protein